MEIQAKNDALPVSLRAMYMGADGKNSIPVSFLLENSKTRHGFN